MRSPCTFPGWVTLLDLGRLMALDLKERHMGWHPLGSVNLHVSMDNLSNPTENQIWLELKMFQGLRSGSDEIFSRKNFPFLINIVLIAHFYSSCPCVFLAIWMSSLEKYLFSTLAHFLIGSYIFLELSCKSCLYIFEIKSLSVASFAIIFFHSEGFHLAYSFLCCAEAFDFN